MIQTLQAQLCSWLQTPVEVKLRRPSRPPSRVVEKSWGETFRRQQAGTFHSVSHSHYPPHYLWVGVGANVPLGVDLEWSKREVRPGLIKRICRDSEELGCLDPLGVWMIKEAAFKSDLDNRGGLVTQYRVHSWTHDKGLLEGPGGRMISAWLTHLEGWRFALARPS